MQLLFTPRRIHSVSELIAQIKKLNEQQFNMIWLEGEIKGFTKASSGHLYFSLSDGKASIRTVMFRPQAAYLRFAPQEGQRILCRGQVSLYSPRGELQFMADTLEPKGAGSEALALAQLKERLHVQGLFKEARKRALPPLPQRVLLITSLQGAALHDFVKVIRRSQSGIQIKIWPSLVQGGQALAELLAAFAYVRQWSWPQVVVLTRGGGSSQDLAIFNEEALALAIAQCPAAVVAAIGHEVDLSIAEMVADARAATPTAAAELLVQPWHSGQNRLKQLTSRLYYATANIIRLQNLKLAGVTAKLRHPGEKLQQQGMRLNHNLIRLRVTGASRMREHQNHLGHLRLRLDRINLHHRINRRRAHVSILKQRALKAAQASLAAQASFWQRHYARLEALNPLAILVRGYALVQDAHNTVIRNSQQLQLDDMVNITLAQGSILAQIKEIKL